MTRQEKEMVFNRMADNTELSLERDCCGDTQAIMIDQLYHILAAIDTTEDTHND